VNDLDRRGGPSLIEGEHAIEIEEDRSHHRPAVTIERLCRAG
jgi:hypothetical protein